MAQFPLIASIFYDLYIKYKPFYSTKSLSFQISIMLQAICIDIGIFMIRVPLTIKINIQINGLKKIKI